MLHHSQNVWIHYQAFACTVKMAAIAPGIISKRVKFIIICYFLHESPCIWRIPFIVLSKYIKSKVDSHHGMALKKQTLKCHSITTLIVSFLVVTFFVTRIKGNTFSHCSGPNPVPNICRVWAKSTNTAHLQLYLNIKAMNLTTTQLSKTCIILFSYWAKSFSFLCYYYALCALRLINVWSTTGLNSLFHRVLVTLIQIMCEVETQKQGQMIY